MFAATNSFAQDTDGDGIPDQLEQRILGIYRPWLYYDHDEPVWPCSATWFVQHSRLIHNPAGDINQSVLQSNPRIILQTSGSYGTWTSANKHSPLKLDIDDNFRTGQFANNPAMSVNVPIYGHVVQLADSPDGSLSYPGFTNTFGSSYIAVQYWMLFPYNDTHAFDLAEQWFTGLSDIGDHEGDWAWIDILLNRSNGLPEYVVYHHHGDGTINPSVVPWSDVEKRDGSPIVYLEKGTHELWPHAGDGHGLTSAMVSLLTGLGSLVDLVSADPTIAIEPHGGNGQQYRPTTVINLGEAGRPFTQTNADSQLDCDLVLLFNGQWGDFTGPAVATETTNPDGPVNQKFPICSGSPQWPVNVYVDFSYSGPELGTPIQPLSHLGDAVPIVARGGTIFILSGFSGEHLTITNICTINTVNGTVTIGQ